MDLSILSWNIRGVRRSEKRRALKSLICKVRPCIVFLQECKLEKISDFEIRKLWGCANMEFEYAPAVGSSGGILCMWNPNILHVSERFSSRRYIALIGVHKQLGVDCGFVNVYGPSSNSKKVKFLEELLTFLNAKRIPWCLGGILT
ncbi:hypothetical protein HRI_004467900 [Hibiscus trionum]|uniref:Endonuclease/exonuclease/phosphatase domain-containing protein n=1 Tax=Hibiscus trionum TaxID=183268 RepID=A0A9W7J4R5_HIBTR|nr:hypothetical protein HRI_004467900 [Hibiscus trionum]